MAESMKEEAAKPEEDTVSKLFENRDKNPRPDLPKEEKSLEKQTLPKSNEAQKPKVADDADGKNRNQESGHRSQENTNTYGGI